MRQQNKAAKQIEFVLVFLSHFFVSSKREQIRNYSFTNKIRRKKINFAQFLLRFNMKQLNNNVGETKARTQKKRVENIRIKTLLKNPDQDLYLPFCVCTVCACCYNTR